MHIADGFLPPLHCLAWTAASAPFVVHGVRRIRQIVDDDPESKLLLAASGAFTFLMSAIKLPSVTGSSSHPTGTGVGAIIFRPPVMAALGTVVLIFQALLLSHGGITTLGANVFSMAIAGPWTGYLCFQVLRRVHPWIAIFTGVALANLSTYVVTSAQLALAHPDPGSGVAGAFGRFLAIFALTQVPLAVIEGLVGVLLFRALRDWAPEQLRTVFAPASAESAVEPEVAGRA